jgi:hypothetical protein
VADLAHKHIIQEPNYVAETWRDKLKLIEPYLDRNIGKNICIFIIHHSLVQPYIWRLTDSKEFFSILVYMVDNFSDESTNFRVVLLS